MADHNAKQPEPVLTRAFVVAALSALSALLVHVGASDVSSWLSVHSDEVAGGVLTLGTLVSGFLARKHVTPLASPQDADGNKLAAIEAPPAVTIEAADVLAAANAVHQMDEAA